MADENQLAEEILDIDSDETTEEQKPQVPEGYVPVKTYTTTRDELKAAKRKLAEIETQKTFDEQIPEPVIEDVKSPMEQWEEENADALHDDPDLPMPVSVFKKQRAFEAQQTKKVEQFQTAKSAKDKLVSSIANAKTSMTDEELGEGLGFDSVVAMGSSLLTQEDLDDIRAVPSRGGKKLYDLSLMRAKEAGLVQSATVPDVTGEKQDKKTQKPTVAPSQNEILERNRPSARLGIRFG